MTGLNAYEYKIIALISDGIIVEKKSNIDELISEWNMNSECPLKITVKPWLELEINQTKEFDWTDDTFLNHLNKNTLYSSKREALIDNIQNMVKTIVVTADWKHAVVKKCIKNDGGYERKFDLVKIKDVNISYRVEGAQGGFISLINLMKLVPTLFTVSNVSMFPSKNPDSFSLFRYFIPHFAERPKGDLEPMIKLVRDHIKVVWCNNNEHNFKWLENWFAWIFQKYPKKTNSIIQITGDEGTGKSCVFEWLVEKVFGELCIVLSGCDKLTRNFNAHLVGKLIVCIEEMSGDNNDLFRIKHIATAPMIDIEKKGIDIETDVNGINIICFSNLDNPMKPIQGINRRLVHMRSNPVYAKNPKYFETLIDFLQNDEIAPIAFFHYYREFVIDQNLLFNQKPVTEEKNFNRFMSLQEVDKAIYYLLVKNPEPVQVTSQQIVSICHQLYPKSNVTAIGVGRRLTNLQFDKKCKDGYYSYIIDRDRFSKYDKELEELCREFCMEEGPINLDNLTQP
jgi:hypothetical protein